MNWPIGELTAEAQARLRELYRTKLARAEADLAAIQAKTLPEDPPQRSRHANRVTALITRIANLRQKLEVEGS